ncbi:glycine zipper domain-containing protein [Salinicola aestuarinus]|uniref:glycine zipper domain-containing protein n=1 Tax=Salinicola aestuarinus TaxID=1949082 RepID=UPI000DA19455|nr:hypothetical protein [Salinicola aestuarinus]
MSLFHRADKDPQVQRLDDDIAAAAETGSQLSDASSTGEPMSARDDFGAEPLEESIDEPPRYVAAYLAGHDGWAERSRRRVNAQVADTCESCDAFVQAKPWQSVGIAAFAGAFVALLIRKR